MFHFVFSLPCWYVIGRFLWPLPWPPAVKVAVAVVLLLGSQYHLYCRLSSGSVFSPEMPRELVIVLSWAFSAILLLALLQIILDGVSLALLVVPGRPAIPPGARYSIGFGAMILSGIGVFQAIRVPPVKEVTIAIKGLQPEFDGYRILQLTDLHLSRLFEEPWARAVVRDANALDADLVLITGDLIDGTIEARRQDVEPLRDLRARDGVYVIPGNHEYFFGQGAWMRYFSSLGMIPLENAHAVVRKHEAQLVIAGVTDVSAAEFGLVPPDLDLALLGAPGNVPIILLDHQPLNARRAAARGVDLQLSGHTHGGLIAGIDRLFALANGGFVSGLYRVEGMLLYVSNGTGLWPGMALRLGRPSELTRITLRRDSGQ